MASIEVLNATQATIEAPVEIQLSLGNPIYRGPKGDPGPAGRDGVIGRDGAQGPKGDTPVKGVDYFTAEDIADFIAQVPAPDLSGYATQTYVENVVRALETGVLKRAIVQSLPVSDIDEYTIYMVPKTGSTGDIYNEYMYLGNDWELIGSTEVDLTGYATEQWINSFINGQSPKRPVRFIDIEPPIGYTTVSWRPDGYEYYKMVLPHSILPASNTDDYEWLNNYLQYGYNEYPTIFRIRPIDGQTNERYTKAYVITRYYNVNSGVWGPDLATECLYLPLDVVNGNTYHYAPYPCHIYDAWSAMGQIYGNDGNNWYLNYSYQGSNMWQTLRGIHTALSNRQAKLTAGSGISLSGSTISSTTEYLTNSDILAIWNGNNE